jgi:hypothetical protein
LALNAIYDQLSDSSPAAFALSLTELLPAGVQALGPPLVGADDTTRENQMRQSGHILARTYCLLQVAAHVAHRSAKPFLISRLTSESLRGYSYGPWLEISDAKIASGFTAANSGGNATFCAMSGVVYCAHHTPEWLYRSPMLLWLPHRLTGGVRLTPLYWWPRSSVQSSG